MKIFLTGATGYIGFNVALAYRRAGHEVWGLVRSDEKARTMARNEIHSVVGSMQQPERYLSIAEECSVLIHSAADYQADVGALDKRTIETFIAAAKKGTQPKTVIYTSGCWVNGNTGSKPVDETAPLKPAKLVTWRPAIEQIVLNTAGIKGVVIRPGCVYGKQGGLTGMWFKGASKDKALKVVGNGDNHWAMVHVDDLAEAYLRAGECNLSGEVFNVSDHSSASVREMVEAVARAIGYTDDIEFIPVAEAARTMGDLAECLALDQQMDARKAARLLEWQPRHSGFVSEVDTYLASWKATQA